MKIMIVHLSDAHFKHDSKFDINKISSIKNIISNTNGISNVIIVFSGDIAFSGKQKEYSLACNLFDEHLSKIKNKNIMYVFAPGNHDCDYSYEKSMRDIAIKSIAKSGDYDDDVVEDVIKVQNNYFEFASLYNFNATKTCPLNSLHSFEFDKKNITINTANSAWMSALDTKPGDSIIKENVFKLDIESDVAILIMHHTPNWFSPDLQRKLKSVFMSYYNFILTGHEHEPYNYQIIGEEKHQHVVMIEGAELSPYESTSNSGFNVIFLDIEKEKYQYLNYKYSKIELLYECINPSSNWKSYHNKKSQISLGFEIKESFLEKLNDPGAPYKHPEIPCLALGDIYVYPNLKNLSKELENPNVKGLSIENFSTISQSIVSNKIIIFGSDRAGKTAALKKLFIDKVDGGFVPIFISAVEISSVNSEKFEKIIIKKFKEQYTCTCIEKFKQSQNDKKVIIIDDLQLAKFPMQKKINLLTYLASAYEHVYVTFDDHIGLEELVFQDSNKEQLVDFYSFYKILPFGYKLRDKLIKKWYCEASNPYLNEEWYKRIDQTAHMLNTVVNHNNVPSFPIYLYTAIMSFDSTKPLNLSNSSYGYYYDMLFTSALSKINIKNEEIDLRTNYLIEFAFFIYSKKSMRINNKELIDFDKQYSSDHEVDTDLERMLREFSTALLISREGGFYFFKYKYFYFYFLAKYFAKTINEESTKKSIKLLCRSLHMEFSANIIMFLTHLSKDDFILSTIIKEAKKLFKDFDVIKFDDDIAFVNDLIGKTPHAILVHRGIEESRMEHLDALEEDISDIDSKCSGKDVVLPEEDSIADGTQDLMLTIRSSQKTIEIIGHILKNYYGSLKRDQKNELCDEAYCLTLRALSDFFDFVSKQKDSLIHFVNEQIDKKEHKLFTLSDFDAIVKQMVFSFSELVSFSFIKTTSDSIGHENLGRTYKNILDKRDYPSIKLIDIAIKIRCYHNFPLEDVKKLSKEFSKNNVCLMVLRDLIINYIYMFPIKSHIRHYLCETFNISIRDSVILHDTAKEKGIDKKNYHNTS